MAETTSPMSAERTRNVPAVRAYTRIQKLDPKARAVAPIMETSVDPLNLPTALFGSARPASSGSQKLGFLTKRKKTSNASISKEIDTMSSGIHSLALWRNCET